MATLTTGLPAYGFLDDLPDVVFSGIMASKVYVTVQLDGRALVVAAEMIASRTGLGYLTWSAYVAGEFPVIIIGMMSIGIAGYVCSAIIRFAGTRMTPWLRTF